MATRSAVQEILENEGFYVQSYSGRGMYGAQCLGVVADDVCDLLPAIVYATQDENREELACAVRGMRHDQFGHERIFYFPGIPFVGEEARARSVG